MEIIDEKGRLFGKINVIDFLVIIFFLSLAPMAYFGYKIVYEKPEPIPPKQEEPIKEFTRITQDAFIIKLNPEIAKLISVGDKEYDKNGESIGEVISVSEIYPYRHKFDVGTKEKLIKNDPELKQVQVTLKMKVGVKDGNVYYKDKQILKDTAFTFITDKYQVEALPFYKEEDSQIIADTVALKADTKFADMDKRLADMDTKFADMDKRLADMDTKFTNMDKRLADMDTKFTNMDKRFANMDMKFANIDMKFVDMDKRFANMDTKFVDMDKRFANMDMKFVDMDKRFANMDTKFVDMDKRLDTLDKKRPRK